MGFSFDVLSSLKLKILADSFPHMYQIFDIYYTFLISPSPHANVGFDALPLYLGCQVKNLHISKIDG